MFSFILFKFKCEHKQEVPGCTLLHSKLLKYLYAIQAVQVICLTDIQSLLNALLIENRLIDQFPAISLQWVDIHMIQLFVVRCLSESVRII